MNLARAALVSIVLMGCTQAEAVKSNTDTNPALAIEKRSDAAIKADRTRAVASALPGIDVSHFQDNIDWPAVKKTGVVFTYIKASGGDTWDDQKFAANWTGSKAAGIKRGAYMFFYPNDTALGEVDNFISKVKLEPGDLPPVIDIETKAKTSQNKDGLAHKLERALIKLEKHYGVKPVIYSSRMFWNDYIEPTLLKRGSGLSFSEYPIWVAEYGVEHPNKMLGWKTDDWTIWQHTATGKVPGIAGDVDMDLFNGSLEDLEKLCVPAPAK